MIKNDFINKKTYLWGTGTEGQAVISWWKENLPDQELKIIENNEIPKDAEVIIKSPGVSIYLPQIEEAKARGVEFTSLINIFLKTLNKQEKKPITITITGTKGKSTAVSMLHFMLQNLGYKSGLGGNIGNNPLTFLGKDLDFIILELSSFQITDLEQKIDYALVLNISQAHTDWHLTFKNYQQDKMKIITLSKHTILNYKDSFLKQIPIDSLTYYNDEKGFNSSGYQIFENSKEISLPKLQIFGEHNISNLCGVLTIMKSLNLDYNKALTFLKDFTPLEHRLQKVYEKNGLIFINDSIATVPESVIAGVNSFDEDIALIVGGYDNNPDYSKLNIFINKNNKIKIALCLPDTGRMLTGKKCLQINNMEEAVKTAIEKLQKGIVLLSPAAPSFNLYNNYRERGIDFTNLAKKLLEEK